MRTFTNNHWSVFFYLEETTVKQESPVEGRRFNLADIAALTDLQSAGLVEKRDDCIGITPLGWKIAAQLRAHKGRGGSFSDFVPGTESE